MRLLPDCRQYGNYQETAFGETKTFLAGTGGDRNLCGYECEIAISYVIRLAPPAMALTRPLQFLAL